MQSLLVPYMQSYIRGLFLADDYEGSSSVVFGTLPSHCSARVTPVGVLEFA